MAVSRWVEIPRQGRKYNILSSGIDPSEVFILLDHFKDGTGILKSTSTGEMVTINLDYIRFPKGDTTFEDIRKCGRPEPKESVKVYRLNSEKISYEQFKENLRRA